MTRSPSRAPRRSLRSARPPAVRARRRPRPAGAHRRTRVAGGLLAGLAVCTAAGVVLPAGETPVRAAAAGQVQAEGVGHPSAIPVPSARRAQRRASRGGPRTALPVTRTVAVGSPFSGEASWYGGSFQGRRTASGEPFNTNDLTAASRTLPFGTRLRVCRVSRCVEVRINDRGPYVGGRVLDLSRAASSALGYAGVAFVTATPVADRSVAVGPPNGSAHQRPVRSSVPLDPPAAAPPVLASATLPDDPPPAVLLAALAVLAGGGLVRGRRRAPRLG